jgi:glutamyl-tRNA synthetase
MRGRYAPSPTGQLHLGNARTALLAYWHTRQRGGTFVMRVEDLDAQRSRPEFVQANLDELRWLGLGWDEGPDIGGAYGPYVQSERFGLYERALKTLEASGHLFECYLSRKDLQNVASAPHGTGAAYGAAQRALNEQVGARKQWEGKPPSLRFRVEPQTLHLCDEVLGRLTLNPAEATGDFVVRRADGAWAYQLAVVVDDLAMNMTHVLRGDDLLPSTGAQLLLYRALGAEPPAFAHVPLLLDMDGTRLAKRKGSLTLSALRAAGVRPERVVGLLAFTLGVVAEPLEAPASDFTGTFDLGSIHKEAFRLDETHLAWLYG